MKKMINVFDHTNEICKAMKKGVLLTTKNGDRINTMTIGWGMIGIEWGKPVFITLVRKSRFTRELLDASGEFTVNIPVNEPAEKILSYCGTHSGREVDKIQQMGLTPAAPISVGAPGFRELPMTLECKVLYRQDQDLAAIPGNLLEKFYPLSDGSRDGHIAYYGEIVNAYLLENA